MKGRPPKPTVQKVTTGTLRKDRTNPKEPAGKVGIPLVPFGMSEGAIEFWLHISPLLSGMQVLIKEDVDALAQMCELDAEIKELRIQIKCEGRTYETQGASGKMIKAHPAVRMLSDARRQFLVHLTHFGLTPAARSKVSIADGDDESEDPAQKYFQ